MKNDGILRRGLGACALLLALAACGGNSESDAPPPAPPPVGVPPTADEAARFLTQASFGPNDADIDAVVASGYAKWIDAQIAMTPSAPQRPYLEMREAQIHGADPKRHAGLDQLSEAFWRQAVTGPDQLRLRTAFALSQLFVISGNDGKVAYRSPPLADYWDMLHANAFGNFRSLLEKVSLHPEMGLYLTSLGNKKEDPVTGVLPDENYAREVMQLFSIGLYLLNPDGTLQLDGGGNPIPTYTHDDIAGLAKVFTGFSYYSPTPSDKSWNSCFGCAPIDHFDYLPMSAYPTYHSTSEKSFLGTTIAASTVPDPTGDLKKALDTIFRHPNVGPFIGRRLIQNFVTSNPSPAYVQRVAAVFDNNGAGVRGDMGAVVRAVLLDTEARDPAKLADPAFGKLREPVIRLANWMRAFEVGSQAQAANGPGGAGFMMFRMDPPESRLGQQPMWAPSVFNFWRPGFVPSGGELAAQGLVAPEFQIVDEVSVAGYMNFMFYVVRDGVGYKPPGGKFSDLHASYAKEVALAADETKLVARLNRLLTYGQMSPTLQAQIAGAVKAVAIPSGATVTQAQIDAALLNRSQLAIYLTLISPEYLAQR